MSHFAKSEVHFSLLVNDCIDPGSLFLFEISTNKGNSVKFLAKFGKVSVLSFFHSHRIDVVRSIQSIDTFWVVTIGMSVIP